MADTRELILARLAEILGGLPATLMGEPGAFVTRARNRGELTDAQRPALILLDGDEKVDDRFIGRGAMAPRLMTMTPEIGIVIGGREPKNELIGEDLNAMRMTVVKAVAHDAGLKTIVGTNGSVEYGGLVTDLGWHRSMEGVMVLSFLITYPFQIARL